MTARQRGDLIDLFGTHAVSRDRVDLLAADSALQHSRYAIRLRMLLIAEGGPLVTNRGRKRYAAILKRHRVLAERADALATLEASPELAAERVLLAALRPDDVRRLPPAGSRTGTRHWDTYDSTLRAAAAWYGAAARGWKFSERELAAVALGGSRSWTDASKLAFATLIGVPFDRAVYTTDTGLRMTGPASWHRQGRLVADLAQAEPFIELPGRSAADDGHLDIQAAGVLMIENQETFEAVSTRTTVPAAWLCFWTGGFASNALAHFLRVRVPTGVPLAAWADLDPPGVKIIRDLSEKSGRAIRPVAMDARLYDGGKKLVEEPEMLQRWLEEATELADNTPDLCADLVAAIVAADGQRCEQEGLHEAVLPTLLQRLNEFAGLHS